LSTHGLGVPYLHVRIDNRPKYYSYKDYKDPAFAAQKISSEETSTQVKPSLRTKSNKRING